MHLRLKMYHLMVEHLRSNLLKILQVDALLILIHSKQIVRQAIPVYWPGGIVPTMTQTASKTDIYSFKFFNGSAITSAGLYGVVGGQNFS